MVGSFSTLRGTSPSISPASIHKYVLPYLLNNWAVNALFSNHQKLILKTFHILCMELVDGSSYSVLQNGFCDIFKVADYKRSQLFFIWNSYNVEKCFRLPSLLPSILWIGASILLHPFYFIDSEDDRLSLVVKKPMDCWT